MSDPKIEKAIARVVDDAREAFGADLVSLVLYGSAAGDEFLHGRSDLNFAIVLEKTTFAHLRSLASLLPGWHRLGAASPLFVDRDFVARARDVFPMELLDIQARHRLLHGVDVFASLVVDFTALRFQLEQEARSKALRLRVLYAESGGKKAAVRALMSDSVKSFLLLMRALLRVSGVDVPGTAVRTLDRFEEEQTLPLPALREVLHVLLDGAEWEREADETFSGYLAGVGSLVGLIDRATHPRADDEAGG